MPAYRPLASDDAWFKSSYSGANTTECVECARAIDATLVRDSTRPDGPVISISNSTWREFLGVLKDH
ncbi:DUF397 domain-containing protein [Streptomyces sp. NPDC016309]|uniref:DUF397 domain-containing protein n=1 Tax=Streptomyces sp. NPDC016309 TaxID=3364965 RepID=UPI0036F899A1